MSNQNNQQPLNMDELNRSINVMVAKAVADALASQTVQQAMARNEPAAQPQPPVVYVNQPPSIWDSITTPSSWSTPTKFIVGAGALTAAGLAGYFIHDLLNDE